MIFALAGISSLPASSASSFSFSFPKASGGKAFSSSSSSPLRYLSVFELSDSRVINTSETASSATVMAASRL